MCAIDRFSGASTIEAPVKKLYFIRMKRVEFSSLFICQWLFSHHREYINAQTHTHNMENIILPHLLWLYDISVLSLYFLFEHGVELSAERVQCGAIVRFVIVVAVLIWFSLGLTIAEIMPTLLITNIWVMSFAARRNGYTFFSLSFCSILPKMAFY